MAIHARRAGWISLALSAAVIGIGADQASASYTAAVNGAYLDVTGNKEADQLVLVLTAPNTLGLDVGADGTIDFEFDRTQFTNIDVSAGGGDDRVVVSDGGGLFTDETITVHGDAGNDVLLGGSGNELLIGGAGNDLIDGNRGSDEEHGDVGADTFQWDPGDGSDVLEGEDGRDTLAFNGANIGEQIDVQPNGNRVRFTRDVASIVQDLGTIENIEYRALGGADRVTVGDLVRTDADTVFAHLAGSDGQGDGAADTVVVSGTSGVDRAKADAPAADQVRISGLAADVIVDGAESPLDFVDVPLGAGADQFTGGVGIFQSTAVRVDGGEGVDSARFNGSDGDDTITSAANGTAIATFADGMTRMDTTAVENVTVAGLAGNDTITGQGNLATLGRLTFDGGDGDDRLRGGNGEDLLRGGAGDDLLDGNMGADELRGGAGDDHAQWDPGDGSDSVDGQIGNDELDFNGSNIGEKIDIFRNGTRTKLTRDVAAITTDFDGIEGVVVRALGGADTLTVDDLRGTGIGTVDLRLDTLTGGGDGATDTVAVNGTGRRDVVDIARDGDAVTVDGLGALRIDGSEPTDQLRVSLFGGDDDFTLAPEVNDLITPVIDLGQGG